MFLTRISVAGHVLPGAVSGTWSLRPAGPRSGVRSSFVHLIAVAVDSVVVVALFLVFRRLEGVVHLRVTVLRFAGQGHGLLLLSRRVVLAWLGIRAPLSQREPRHQDEHNDNVADDDCLHFVHTRALLLLRLMIKI